MTIWNVHKGTFAAYLCISSNNAAFVKFAWNTSLPVSLHHISFVSHSVSSVSMILTFQQNVSHLWIWNMHEPHRERERETEMQLEVFFNSNNFWILLFTIAMNEPQWDLSFRTCEIVCAEWQLNEKLYVKLIFANYDDDLSHSLSKWILPNAFGSCSFRGNNSYSICSWNWHVCLSFTEKQYTTICNLNVR